MVLKVNMKLNKNLKVEYFCTKSKIINDFFLKIPKKKIEIVKMRPTFEICKNT